MPTQLLVSVKDFGEFELAREVGVTWIDLKDPDQGSLGKPGLPFVRQVHKFCLDFPARDYKISLALGELPELDLDHLEPEVCDFDFVKVALSGFCPDVDRFKLYRLSSLLRDPGQLILVHYADHQVAAAPPFSQVLEMALALKCRYLLIDTYRKSAGNLFHWYEPNELDQLIQQARKVGMAVSLAGSLRVEELQRAAGLQPDVLAVRGAACEVGDRKNSLSERRMVDLVKLANRNFQQFESNAPSDGDLHLRIT